MYNYLGYCCCNLLCRHWKGDIKQATETETGALAKRAKGHQNEEYARVCACRYVRQEGEVKVQVNGGYACLCVGERGCVEKAKEERKGNVN